MDSKNSVFLDTSFLKALIDPKDDFHKDALPINSKLVHENLTLITSNYIVDESFTLVRVKCGLTKAIELKERLSRGMKLKITRVIAQDDRSAWNWFINEWKGLSFTDCASFALMKRLGLTRVATFDSHFTKAGFSTVR